jgi:hypothetical protein
MAAFSETSEQQAVRDSSQRRVGKQQIPNKHLLRVLCHVIIILQISGLAQIQRENAAARPRSRNSTALSHLPCEREREKPGVHSMAAILKLPNFCLSLGN